MYIFSSQLRSFPDCLLSVSRAASKRRKKSEDRRGGGARLSLLMIALRRYYRASARRNRAYLESLLEDYRNSIASRAPRIIRTLRIYDDGVHTESAPRASSSRLADDPSPRSCSEIGRLIKTSRVIYWPNAGQLRLSAAAIRRSIKPARICDTSADIETGQSTLPRRVVHRAETRINPRLIREVRKPRYICHRDYYAAIRYCRSHIRETDARRRFSIIRARSCCYTLASFQRVIPPIEARERVRETAKYEESRILF